MKTNPRFDSATPALREARTPNARCRLAALLVCALTPLGAVAQAAPAALQELTVEQLKRVYLACDRASLEGRPVASEIALCSIVYEELKRRAFDGDFDKLLAWSRQTPSRRSDGS